MQLMWLRMLWTRLRGSSFSLRLRALFWGVSEPLTKCPFGKRSLPRLVSPHYPSATSQRLRQNVWSRGVQQEGFMSRSVKSHLCYAGSAESSSQLPLGGADQKQHFQTSRGRLVFCNSQFMAEVSSLLYSDNMSINIEQCSELAPLLWLNPCDQLSCLWVSPLLIVYLV